MIAPPFPLDAFRADLAAGLLEAPELHGVWVMISELIQRLSSAAVDGLPPTAADAILAHLDRLTHAALERSGRRSPPPTDHDPAAHAADGATGASCETASSTAELAAAVVDVAEQMELSGAVRLAWSTLVLVERTLHDMAPRTRGFSLANRARIARKLGALDVASTLYADAVRVGRTIPDPALVVRATLGRGVVARVRGNYPEARARFEEGARVAARLQLRALESHAHHGLLLVAEAAGDYDRALRHGWVAYELAAGDPAREAELLVNLAAICGLSGAPAAAIHAYLAAAERVTEPRVRVMALAGAAVDAATLAHVPLLGALTDAVRRELTVGGLPYEAARANLLLARAWLKAESLRTTQAEGFREPRTFADRSRMIARAHAFHEILHEVGLLEQQISDGQGARSGGPSSVPRDAARTHLAVELQTRRSDGGAGRNGRRVGDETAASASTGATVSGSATRDRMRNPRARAVISALASLPLQHTVVCGTSW